MQKMVNSIAKITYTGCEDVQEGLSDGVAVTKSVFDTLLYAVSIIEERVSL